MITLPSFEEETKHTCLCGAKSNNNMLLKEIGLIFCTEYSHSRMQDTLPFKLIGLGLFP